MRCSARQNTMSSKSLIREERGRKVVSVACKECTEQARLLGMGAQREARLKTINAALLRAAKDIYFFVEEDKDSIASVPKYLVAIKRLKETIESAEKEAGDEKKCSPRPH